MLVTFIEFFNEHSRGLEASLLATIALVAVNACGSNIFAQPINLLKLSYEIVDNIRASNVFNI